MSEKLNELKKPENREIVTAYAGAIFSRVDSEVYTPVGKKFSSLKNEVTKLREENDPIFYIEAKSLVQKAFPTIKKVLLIAELATDDNRAANARDKLTMSTQAYEKFVPMLEQFYFDSVCAIKEMSEQKNKDIGDVVNNIDCTDEVNRIVFPTREEAELFFKARMDSKKTSYESRKSFVDLVKHSKNSPLNPWFKLIDTNVPTDKALEAMYNAFTDYKTKEFDRIYSGK
jgi:hypothetical protein